MKKKTLSILALMAASVLALGACTNNGNSDPASVSGNGTPSAGALDPTATGYVISVLDYDMTQYATIGDYKNLELDYQPIELTEEDMISESVSYLAQIAGQIAEPEMITDRPVEYGDIVCLDYCGKEDGVPFDGGTGTGYLLGIGSGAFIPGFEDGLIGWMPGEEQDLPIAFPEDYHSADLAGKEVVFTCTVQYIISADSLIAEANLHLEEGQEPFNTMEDYRKFYMEELQKQLVEYNKSNMKDSFYYALPGIVTVSQTLPEELVSSYNLQVMRVISSMATSYGVDAETYAGYYGQSLDTLVTDYANEQMNYDIALYLIAAENNILPTDEEFRVWLADLKGDATDAEFFAGISESEYRIYFFEEHVTDFLLENFYS